jgi:hypothetical protein
MQISHFLSQKPEQLVRFTASASTDKNTEVIYNLQAVRLGGASDPPWKGWKYPPVVLVRPTRPLSHPTLVRADLNLTSEEALVGWEGDGPSRMFTRLKTYNCVAVRPIPNDPDPGHLPMFFVLVVEPVLEGRVRGPGREVTDFNGGI